VIELFKMKKYRTALLIVIFALLMSALNWRCNSFNNYFSQVKIKDIQLMNLPGNRLRFKVIVTCKVAAKVCLKYWKINTKDTLYTDVTDSNKTDTINILNTEAESRYRFQAIAYNQYSKYLSKPHDFQTQLIYHATPYFDLETMDTKFEPEIHNKYFLTQILTEPGSLVIINSKGNIVWYQPFKKGVKVSHWTSKGTILCIVGSEKIPSSGGDEIYEMDLTGKVLRHLKVGQGDMDKLVHHEVRYDNAGNLYALTFTNKLFDLSTVGGLKSDTVHGDGIVVFNKEGKKIWEWSILDHLNPLGDPKILKTKKDWVHGNSLFKDKDGNFLISFRDLSQFWKVEYPSGKVLWKLGEKGDFKIDTNDVFSGQHSVHINEYGQLMMLDNGAKRKLSSAMAFTIDTAHKKAFAKFRVPLAKEYFSATKGNCSLFDHNKILFCLTDPKVFLITDMQGKILWKVNLAGDPYRVEEAKGFFKNKPFINGNTKF
jgi:arylsulfate sulfotransferase